MIGETAFKLDGFLVDPIEQLTRLGVAGMRAIGDAASALDMAGFARDQTALVRWLNANGKLDAASVGHTSRKKAIQWVTHEIEITAKADCKK